MRTCSAKWPAESSDPEGRRKHIDGPQPRGLHIVLVLSHPHPGPAAALVQIAQLPRQERAGASGSAARIWDKCT